MLPKPFVKAAAFGMTKAHRVLAGICSSSEAETAAGVAGASGQPEVLFLSEEQLLQPFVSNKSEPTPISVREETKRMTRPSVWAKIHSRGIA
jgi:hypothetical protein